jgi:hypothetical protein
MTCQGRPRPWVPLPGGLGAEPPALQRACPEGRAGARGRGARVLTQGPPHPRRANDFPRSSGIRCCLASTRYPPRPPSARPPSEITSANALCLERAMVVGRLALDGLRVGRLGEIAGSRYLAGPDPEDPRVEGGSVPRGSEASRAERLSRRCFAVYRVGLFWGPLEASHRQEGRPVRGARNGLKSQTLNSPGALEGRT